MKTVWRRPLGLVAVLILLALVISACGPTKARGEGFDLTRDYRLSSGERLQGDQVILAYGVRLEPGSAITGNATLTGKTVQLDGTVEGGVVVVADRFAMGPQARVGGDLVVCAKTMVRDAAAQVGGTFKEECTNTGRDSLSSVMNSGWDRWRGSPLFRAGSVLVGALLFGALTALLTAVFPRPLVRMSQAVRRAPLIAGGVGLLTWLAALMLTGVYGLSLLLLVPIVLLPFVIVGWLLILLLSVLGWMALAQPFGDALMRRFGGGAHPPMIAAGIGAAALAVLVRVWSVFWFTAWIGLLAMAVLGSVGLGAVILTRAGRRPYPPAA